MCSINFIHLAYGIHLFVIKFMYNSIRDRLSATFHLASYLLAMVIVIIILIMAMLIALPSHSAI